MFRGAVARGARYGLHALRVGIAFSVGSALWAGLLTRTPALWAGLLTRTPLDYVHWDAQRRRSSRGSIRPTRVAGGSRVLGS